MKINASHFKTMEELIRHINMCVREEDIFALERYVGLNELDILVKEIARLKNAIDKIKSIMNEYDFSYNDEWYEEPTSQELRDDYYAQSYIDIHRVYLILQELKEEIKNYE